MWRYYVRNSFCMGDDGKSFCVRDNMEYKATFQFFD